MLAVRKRSPLAIRMNAGARFVGEFFEHTPAVLKRFFQCLGRLAQVLFFLPQQQQRHLRLLHHVHRIAAHNKVSNA